MNKLAEYISGRDDLTPEQQDEWLAYCHLLEDDDATELLEQFIEEPDTLLTMSDDIKEKREALASGGTGAIASILTREESELT